MIDLLFNSLWGWAGVGGLVIAGALAVAWFVPPLRGLALTVAGAAAGALTLYGKGYADAARRKDAQREKAERAMEAKGHAARAAAERAHDAGELHDDEFDRDRREVRGL